MTNENKLNSSLYIFDGNENKKPHIPSHKRWTEFLINSSALPKRTRYHRSQEMKTCCGRWTVQGLKIHKSRRYEGS